MRDTNTCEVINDKKKKYPNSLPRLRMFDSWIIMVIKSIKNMPVKKVISIKPIILKGLSKNTKIIPKTTDPAEIIRSFTLSLKKSTISPPITRVTITVRTMVELITSCKISSGLKLIMYATMKFIEIEEKMNDIKKIINLNPEIAISLTNKRSKVIIFEYRARISFNSTIFPQLYLISCIIY